MKLWILSDLHDDHGLLVDEFRRSRPADFDVFVCAGDMMSGDIEGSIEATAALAGGKPSVFVAGNHEWMTDTLEETLELAHTAAHKHGVHFLECDAVDIGGVRFAGATLWTPDDPRWPPSVVALCTLKADAIVTHFEPAFPMFSLLGSKLWIYGHHHGFADMGLGARRLVRNALGYSGERIDGASAIPDYVVEI